MSELSRCADNGYHFDINQAIDTLNVATIGN